MKNRSKRLNQLVAILKENETVSVRRLAELLGVSEMTIRRDLDTLKSEAIVDRSYGSATYRRNSVVENTVSNYELYSAKIQQNEEKDRIGKFAATLIEPGDVVIIDSGSTADKLARYMPEDMDITVLCYNYNVLSCLINKTLTKLIFPGGYYHPTEQLFESPQSIELIGEIRATKAFISATGVHEKLGITCANNYEVPNKRTVIQSAQTKILITDSSKFGKVSPAYFAQLNEMDMIITDSGLSSDWKSFIEQADIELSLV
ncbi:Deoxyribose operon repressor [Caprobacter fermentans]|uniref:DeoR/GlpR transcriptional regulator n=1 Tax=Caproicibacter fermentans TaxID=2576756 RepID=A0A6N8HWW9_9FIRM|nr:DeoR/GlpR family DNA-binding transcription regulator [Caproicibacter fermentans]MVB10095.1 Deoxyribose operon repressor [Caproicibacter fermentans]OCN03440.1 DeoR family transcriptional regulator [Clostridium sp. W14A]QNK40168.1 DeoR/GlpR transcriptional regulator [Caproicibacter fermentans]